ncbi:MAG: DUF1415 domain-containing protein [Zoogloeaceae bacterium]|nr:DUF1415 domain-containing protein [Zoogloeaceae bacterium]
MNTPNPDAVIAAMRHWLEQAVIGLNLCPFAKSVYVANRVRFVVSDAPHVDAFLEQLDTELDFLAAADPKDVDTTLLIHPTMFDDFETFNDIVGIAEEAVEEHELEGVLQVASFHPRFQFADTEPDDLGNYTNRAPYPTLHLLREDSIAGALAHHPQDPDSIFERNIETMEKLGQAGWDALGIRPAKDQE